MAAGILAATTGTYSFSAPSVTTIYTCPAGVSYAVVHVLYNAAITMTLANTDGYYALQAQGVTFAKDTQSTVGTKNSNGASSLIVGAGESISIEAKGFTGSGTTNWNIVVSGYEVA